MLMKFATSVTAFIFLLFWYPVSSQRNSHTWFGQGCSIMAVPFGKKEWVFTSSNYQYGRGWEGSWVEFSALSGRGKCLGRSGYLRCINTWCKACVAGRSLAPTTHAIRRRKDFKVGERFIWQAVAKRMSLGGLKPGKDSLKLLNYSMMESKHTVFNLMVHHV